ncbi:hypothetical protein diail_3589 [Diaporthe ilicicola]|nr:hypothetical protein diail_3589 [Diaporthe ilicicola]
MFAALSPTAPVEQPTAGEVISEWPLCKVARYVRQMTDSVTEQSLAATLNLVATVRDKTSLNCHIDAQPPLSILQTDHRDAKTLIEDPEWNKLFEYRGVDAEDASAAVNGVNRDVKPVPVTV